MRNLISGRKTKTASSIVRKVAVKDLPENVRAQAGGLEALYAVHRADGEQLALVRDRALAFVLARQNDLAPVAVH